MLRIGESEGQLEAELERGTEPRGWGRTGAVVCRWAGRGRQVGRPNAVVNYLVGADGMVARGGRRGGALLPRGGGLRARGATSPRREPLPPWSHTPPPPTFAPVPPPAHARPAPTLPSPAPAHIYPPSPSSAAPHLCPILMLPRGPSPPRCLALSFPCPLSFRSAPMPPVLVNAVGKTADVSRVPPATRSARQTLVNARIRGEHGHGASVCSRVRAVETRAVRARGCAGPAASELRA